MLRQYFAIQAVPSDCSSTPPPGSAIERSNGPILFQPEEAALEHVVAERVLAVDPPGEIDQELLEDAREEVEILAAVDPEHRQRRPR